MPPVVDTPHWLLRLRAAVFAHPAMPERDEAFTHDEQTYMAERSIEMDSGRLFFHEVWRDPFTYRPAKTWQHEIEAGAFAGAIPEPIFQQQVAVMVQWLTLARPRRQPRERQEPFTPQRFAAHPRRRTE